MRFMLTLFITIGFLVGSALHAQQLQMDTVEVERNGTVYNFSYYSDRDGQDTVLHGRYIETTILPTGSSLVQGTYAHGIHQGGWIYKTRNESPSAGEHPYRLEVAGEFRAFVPHGKWTIKVWDLGNEGKLRSEVTLHYDYGRYLGAISYSASEVEHARDVTVTGFVAPADYMDSTWVFRYTTDEGTFEERRSYRHGYLLSSELRDVASGRLVREGRNDVVARWVDSLEHVTDRYTLSRMAGPEPVVLFLQAHRYNTIDGLDVGNALLNSGLNVYCQISTKLIPGCHPLYLHNLSPNRTAARLADIDAALASAPDDGSLYYQRGKLFSDIERYDSAERAFTRAIELAYRRDTASFLRGRARMALKNYTEAAEDFRNSFELGYNGISCYRALSEARYKAGDYQASIEACQQALSEKPSTNWAKYRIGLALLANGEVDRGRFIYRSACRSQTGDIDAFREAITELQTLAERGPQRDAAQAIMRDYFGLSDKEIQRGVAGEDAK